MHFGPNGTVNDAKDYQASAGNENLGEEFKPKELETFVSDRERVLNVGAFPLQDGTQYPLEKVNVTGNEDYKSQEKNNAY